MFNMSTKKIFDDMFVYLREVNRKHLKSLQNIDDMNGMPVDSYSEFTSRFWNLIYKEPYHQTKDNSKDSKETLTDVEKELLRGPDILTIDDEIKYRQKHDIANLNLDKMSQEFIGGPNPHLETNLNLVLAQTKRGPRTLSNLRGSSI